MFADDPGLRLLTGPDVSDLLDAALAPAGARLVGWRPRDVDCRPGNRTTVSYTATVAWPDGEREETLGATASAKPPAGTASHDWLTVTDGERHVQVWRYPFDPELPGLPGVCHPSAVAELLGVDPAGVRLNVVSYRPRKRAVIEVEAGSTRLFLKALRPRRAAAVHRRHQLLAEAGVPAPRSLGWSEDGVVALTALPGTSMRSALAQRRGSLPPAGELVRLLEALPTTTLDLPRREPWSAHASHYAEVVASGRPRDAGLARALARQIDSELADFAGDGDEPTHGDFYDAQVFVSDATITGVLDIDTMGPGRRADDLACMLAHLSVQALPATAESPAAAAGAEAATRACAPAFERIADPRELRSRVAGVVLSLATGPFRAQAPGWPEATSALLRLAERWLDAAGSRRAWNVAERALIRLS